MHIQFSFQDLTAYFPGVGWGQVKRVVHKEEVRIPGLHPALKPGRDNFWRALPEDRAFNGGC